jgi:hypothetical protein
LRQSWPSRPTQLPALPSPQLPRERFSPHVDSSRFPSAGGAAKGAKSPRKGGFQRLGGMGGWMEGCWKGVGSGLEPGLEGGLEGRWKAKTGVGRGLEGPYRSPSHRPTPGDGPATIRLRSLEAEPFVST